MERSSREAFFALAIAYLVISAVLLGGSVYARELRLELIWIWLALTALILLCVEAALVVAAGRRMPGKNLRNLDGKEKIK